MKNLKVDLNSKDIQLQYEGFLNTPLLWKGNDVYNLEQLEIKKTLSSCFNGNISKNLRLGKRVERFVAHLLKQQENTIILAENCQIQNEKTTVGEIDFIIQQNKKPIHIEVIYKFYLLDETVGETELEHWIGPNRKDSLIEKLTKLSEKQLPLLYNLHTKPLLQNLNLLAESIEQKVFFKAQLFTPFNYNNSHLKLINTNCIIGFYVVFKQLKNFSDCKFYIPEKINWLQNIKTQVKWLNFSEFTTKIEPILNNKTAPLCWLKHPNGEVTKIFVVWWTH